MSESKPILIYDGECRFCIRWIDCWRRLTQDRVEYAPSQEVSHRYPQIPEEKFSESVQLVLPEGKVYGGAEAVFRTLAYAPGKKWIFEGYRTVPGFAPAADLLYRFVAGHRTGFSRGSRWLWGDSLECPAYFLVRRLFLALLGIIYFIAFVSFWVQAEGLVGTDGILPMARFLEAVRENTGLERYWLLPTLFWLDAGDGFLNFLCLAGAGLSLCAGAGYFPALALFFSWLFYLSLVVAGREFMAFQWDSLLLQMGFLAIFLAPFRIRPRRAGEPEPSLLVLFLYRVLFFQVMFSSGMAKWMSGDPSWRNATALQYHYETQPLPTWGGWYAHQLPAWFQDFSVGCVFVIQVAVPFLIFAPRRIRWAAFWILTGFQGLIMITGNYGFFNLLTLALCLLLLDDACLKRWLPRPWVSGTEPARRRPREPRVKTLLVAVLAATLLFLTVTLQLAPLVDRNISIPRIAQTLYQWIRPFYIVNGYGLFAVMTTKRREIIIEGSRDAQNWKSYEFKWKPGNLKMAPAFVAPHQPRLDWQMWFAALGSYRQNPWLINLMMRLLQGSPTVLGLLAHNPFPGHPPRFIRAVVYRYWFTDFPGWRADGSWWRREWRGLYTPVLQLPDSP
ncbi:MAG: lipase maturation factor family protein [Nitrospinaceae bacterium]